MRELNPYFKKKKKAQAGSEWSNTLPKILASEEKATITKQSRPGSNIVLYSLGSHTITKQLHHHHRRLSLNREGRWGTTDDFATSLLHFPLFSTARASSKGPIKQE